MCVSSSSSPPCNLKLNEVKMKQSKKSDFLAFSVLLLPCLLEMVLRLHLHINRHAFFLVMIVFSCVHSSFQEQQSIEFLREPVDPMRDDFRSFASETKATHPVDAFQRTVFLSIE